MPREILESIVHKKSWTDFVKDVEEKAPRRKPVRAKGSAQRTGTLWAIRNKRLTIRESALRRVTVMLVYRKVTTNEVKRYEFIPLSYRYRKLKIGFRKVLYGYDKRDEKQLKSLVLTNIMNVALTDHKFVPNPAFPVEIF